MRKNIVHVISIGKIKTKHYEMDVSNSLVIDCYFDRIHIYPKDNIFKYEMSGSFKHLSDNEIQIDKSELKKSLLENFENKYNERFPKHLEFKLFGIIDGVEFMRFDEKKEFYEKNPEFIPIEDLSKEGLLKVMI